MKDLLGSLLSKTPVGLGTLGVVVIVIGAAGEVPAAQVEFQGGWRIFLLVCGAILESAAISLAWFESRMNPKAATSDVQTEVKASIVAPGEGTVVGVELNVSGTFEGTLGHLTLHIFATTPDRKSHRPLGRPQIDAVRKTWHLSALSGDLPGEFHVEVASAGGNGRALMKFFQTTEACLGKIPWIECLTEDIVIHDRVRVVRASPIQIEATS